MKNSNISVHLSSLIKIDKAAGVRARQISPLLMEWSLELIKL